jgi:hypothetical protein
LREPSAQCAGQPRQFGMFGEQVVKNGATAPSRPNYYYRLSVIHGQRSLILAVREL